MLTSHNTTRQLEESGIDTALIPFGSTEQFGPYLAHVYSIPLT